MSKVAVVNRYASSIMACVLMSICICTKLSMSMRPVPNLLAPSPRIVTFTKSYLGCAFCHGGNNGKNYDLPDWTDTHCQFPLIPEEYIIIEGVFE